MRAYNFAGQEITFSCPLSELDTFSPLGVAELDIPDVIPPPSSLLTSTTGWVANADRPVEVWTTSDGYILRVSGSRDLYIHPQGSAILPTAGDPELTPVEREVALGPALVLALALGGKWCLHASAASHQGQGMVFLGESGDGKSTLAAYLNSTDSSTWQQIADDILPVTLEPGGLIGWPHFPQLKLPVHEQPWLSLPEQVPLSRIYVLSQAEKDAGAAVEQLSASQAVQVLLSHTAGTRLFNPELLERHLEFCAQAAARVPVFRLSYPHRWEVLKSVKEILAA